MAQCTAHLRDGSGKQCRKPAISGATVCGSHGGSAPQVKQAARMRLLEAIDPAAAELARLALSAKNERDRIAAIKELFERAGFGEAKRVEVITMDMVEAEIMRLEQEMDESELERIRLEAHDGNS